MGPTSAPPGVVQSVVHLQQERHRREAGLLSRPVTVMTTAHLVRRPTRLWLVSGIRILGLLQHTPQSGWFKTMEICSQSLEVTNPKPESVGPPSLWRPPGRVLPASSSFWWLQPSLHLWLHHSHPCSASAWLPPLLSELSFHLPFIKTLVTVGRAHLDNPERSPYLKMVNLIPSAKTLFPMRSHAPVLGIRACTCPWGPLFSPPQQLITIL